MNAKPSCFTNNVDVFGTVNCGQKVLQLQAICILEK